MFKINVHTLIDYLAVIFLSLICFFFITHLWNANFYTTFCYTGSDCKFGSMFVKSTMEEGWFITNSRLGAPGGYNLSDFPVGESLFFGIIKLFSLLTTNYAIAFNAIYLLTFPLTAITAFFVLKRLNIFRPFAIVASVLFSLLPYHFIHGEENEFLSAYYVIPLVTWLSVLLAENKLFSCVGNNSISKKSYFRWLISYLGLCIIIGCGGAYYAFFASFFLLLSGIIGSISYSRFQALGYACIFICTISLSLIINLLPTLIYHSEYGKNLEVARRPNQDAENYGLKITHLLLPVRSSENGSLSRLNNRYLYTAPVLSAGFAPALGLFGSIGFIFLLSMLFIKKTWLVINKQLEIISQLTIGSVLLATIGGFGSVIAYTVTPSIRCYYRIGIFIAFFSLTAFFSVIQNALSRYSSKNIWFLSSFLLIIGAYFQTSDRFIIQKTTKESSEFSLDQQFIQKIESILPKQSLVYQLPYMSFPEAGIINKMRDYDHFRGYLHSNHLKWSYGAIRGRGVDLWQRSLSSQPIVNVINSLAYLGFSGVYIDYFGYTDNGVNVEKELSHLLNQKPIKNTSNRLGFYDLRDYAETLKQTEAATEWQTHVDTEYNKISLYTTWDSGCSAMEGSPPLTWRWCDKHVKIMVHNTSSHSIRTQIHFGLLTIFPDAISITAKGDLLNKTFTINGSEVFKVNATKTFPINAYEVLIDKTMDVPPGNHPIYVDTNSKRIDWYDNKNPYFDDSRNIYFAIRNFSTVVQ